jgi:hypothetical protein
MMFRKRPQKNKGDEQSRKARGRGPGRPDEKLAKRVLGRDSGRHTFGFSCSPDIHARIKILAGELHVPMFALTEHLLQLAVWLITRAKENPEEMEQLRRHLVQIHVEARTIEKLNFYDEQLAKDLDEQRLRRFAIESTVRQIVEDFTNKGMNPKDIPSYIDYGYRCFVAVDSGRPVPKDLPPWAGWRRRSSTSGNRPTGAKKEETSGSSKEPGE